MKMPHKGEIDVLFASYGDSNVTRLVSDVCNGVISCDYTVSSNRLGDPQINHVKAFAVMYRCGKSVHATQLEASDLKSVQLSCDGSSPAGAPIKIRSATYGSSVVTQKTADICNGVVECQFLPLVAHLKDPQMGVSKNFEVSYSCGADLKSEIIYPEAANKPTTLSCANYAAQNQPISKNLKIVSAFYGNQNVTQKIAQFCDNSTRCEYAVSVAHLGDTQPQTAKPFIASFRCPNNRVYTEVVGPEASGKKALIECPIATIDQNPR